MWCRWERQRIRRRAAVTLAQVWTPGHHYFAGQVVAYQGLLLRCTWTHETPADADEPWYAHSHDQPLRARLRRWHIAYDEMKATQPGDTAA